MHRLAATTDGQTDRILKINTSLIVRGNVAQAINPGLGGLNANDLRAIF
jgi:hypothetical protein